MSPPNLSFITTLLLVFVSAIIGGILAKRMKLPMVVGYIAAGVVFGNITPAIADRPFLELIADIGVTLLLFTLGVEFSFHRLRRILGKITWAAVVQILLTFIVFVSLFMVSGFPYIAALFLGAAVSLSSTAVVIKLLSDRGEIETHSGEIATGWLVVQDLAVIPMMIILPTLISSGLGHNATIASTLFITGLNIVKSGLVIALVISFGRMWIGRLLTYVARQGSRELFLVVTVGIVFLAGLVVYSAGLSIALGAFIAGLLVAETSQSHAIFAEIRPLRDVFAVVFFVTLGMVLPHTVLITQATNILIFTVLVLLIKLFIILGLCRYLGLHRKTAFLVALALTQISEFGFILAKVGVEAGALTQNQYVFLAALTFATIAVSAPLIVNGQRVYYWVYKTFGNLLPNIFPVQDEVLTLHDELPLRGHIVICGYGRVGKYIGRALALAGLPFLVIDYNHTTVSTLRGKGIQVVYGDPADREVLDCAQVDYAKVLIIAIPDRHTQVMIIGHAQTLNRRIKIICRTHHEEDQAHLKSLGVASVVQPEFEAAIAIVQRLLPEFGVPPDDVVGKISRLKIEHGMG